MNSRNKFTPPVHVVQQKANHSPARPGWSGMKTVTPVKPFAPSPPTSARPPMPGSSQLPNARPQPGTRVVQPKVSTSQRVVHTVTGIATAPRFPNTIQRSSGKHAHHGQLFGRLARLPPGPSKDAASTALHQWKQAKGYRGESVTGRERDELEWSIVLSLVTKYGRELLNAGYSADDLRRARYDLLSDNDKAFFALPRVRIAPPPPKPPPPPQPTVAALPGIVRGEHAGGTSIRKLAKRYRLTRNQVRDLVA
jgi:hypothetical protein